MVELLLSHGTANDRDAAPRDVRVPRRVIATPALLVQWLFIGVLVVVVAAPALLAASRHGLCGGP